MASIVIMVTVYLAYTGYSYYVLPLEERFYHPRHDWFKPSGLYGHGLGIVGTLCILVGVGTYIARKRYNVMGRFIRLKYLLEFHIFLCVLGPVMILFHTSFKFGGIVSIAFWSMVAVVLSGVIGRFIYIQIPRTIEGRELSLQEVKEMQDKLTEELTSKSDEDPEYLEQLIQSLKQDKKNEELSFIQQFFQDRKTVKNIRTQLRHRNIGKEERKHIIDIVKREISLSNKIKRLQYMQKLFKYWHVAHLPFALIMLIIVVIHVGITLAFGYQWIF